MAYFLCQVVKNVLVQISSVFPDCHLRAAFLRSNELTPVDRANQRVIGVAWSPAGGGQAGPTLTSQQTLRFHRVHRVADGGILGRRVIGSPPFFRTSLIRQAVAPWRR